MPYRSAVLEFTSPQRLMNWLRDLPPGVRGNVRKVSFYKSSVAGLISRETASDSNVGAQQHDWLIEACSSLQGLERVHLGTYTRTFDTELTAGVEFLQEQLVKSDGRKVEVVLRTRVLS
ncbi:uncharacterized protein J4E88_008835 [Alternaria novae-zelandiae]|uniref:uncharacterized protein n=1 Tax=Alternaria novae-zelandiae TaxID=430562 RepID=UPI0020C207D1|nr:uncharacterized protein J4E88_008835 [Alternaria novae-zelandiae]KAI4673223.1 hypothetical protein J4E88_008835 [Alternaria novae-zelandiae]